ncbi:MULTISPECIES: hypothetical protein [unclassified Devosia]|uniref:hypothetical protein n=1 Tax=unclassified Devosia TaxID=196773 RepID=UPI001553ADD7|nr:MULTISPECIES: hypothetical protein [unclassified Devosia]
MANRFPWRFYLLALAVIVFLALLPLMSVWLATSLADWHNCQLDEGSVHACMIAGADWGEALYAMALMGWLMLASIPLGGGAVLVWLIMLTIHWLAWRRHTRLPQG